ncbi:sugar porter family MFS transporter [Leuconostoc gelidum subsp. gasicomitatum]|uniref:sugar porter family MFS transporter n=1 Tax=Leuconostoc gasicomitatum TaxID=115778 RepID=UPI0007E19331|nr:sugar porter family MFS transporter [Leuconostoc gasicomitatum]MBR2277418.1 sugar porter family MFS transporter [Leuconostoc sp.]MBZ5953525.1 sugar porter family MFS transporter [Leuconostoc gasicomitatum]CUW13991.1 D-xylose proton-symporter XylT [Leuconostoc gasicomitatum]
MNHTRHLSTNFVYFFGALGGLLFGYDTGVISGAMLFIGKELGIKSGSFQDGFITASVLLGAIIGAAVIGPLSDKLGRKKLLLIAAIIFFTGALGSGIGINYTVLVVSRVILGIAVGAASALIPTYLAELSPADKRGGIGTLFQLMIMTGIFFAYVSNEWLSPNGFLGLKENVGWHWMLGLAAIPAALLFFGGLRLPESPRFLVRNGKIDDAKRVLSQMNPNAKLVEEELHDIQLQANIPSGGFKELFGVMARPVLIMALGLAIFQQVMGCNTVLYYAPKIFISAGFSEHFALQSHIVIGLFNVIVTAIAVKIMDKIDRKKMLTYGAIGMGISLLLMSTAMLVLQAGNGNLGSWVCVISLTLYIAFFSATWGPVMWVMIGEAFPLNIRGLGNSFGAVINWTANFAVSQTFPMLLIAFTPANAINSEGKGIAKLFLIYGALCFVAIWFIAKFTIETRNRSLESIEAGLRSKAHAKMPYNHKSSLL